MATAGESCSARGLLSRGLALQKELRSWGGPGSARLLKLVRGELAFLNRLTALPALAPSCPELRSSNFDHLEAVFRILQNPLVSGVSAVLQSFSATVSEDSADDEREVLAKDEPGGGPAAHIDVVCMLHGKPIWLVISTRNPRYVMWRDSAKQVKGLRSRLLLLTKVACSDVVTKPASIVLCFSGDVDYEVDLGLRDEFGAVRGFALGDDRIAHVHVSSSTSSLESSMVVLNPRDIHPQDDCNFSEVEGGEWLDVEVNLDTPAENTTSPAWVTYEVDTARFSEASRTGKDLSTSELKAYAVADVHGEAEDEAKSASSVHETVLSVVTQNAEELEPDHSSRSVHYDRGLINLDTTALVAVISEVSNGGAEYLLTLEDEDMVKRFSSMITFIREQALSEVDKPLVKEIEDIMARRQPVVCQYVHDEFNSIVSLVGGPKEQDRAKKFLQRVRVVPNTPSDRIMALTLTGKIKSRHKLVFGTGDQLNIPTLTANMAFVRAARQKGMAIEVMEHRPRALTGD